MPGAFFEMLAKLGKLDAEYQQACDNITSDCCHIEDNPNGLCDELLQSLDQACNDLQLADDADDNQKNTFINSIRTLVHEHTCVHKPEHHRAYDPPAAQLIRIVPIRDFAYHEFINYTMDNTLRRKYVKSKIGTEQSFNKEKLEGSIARLTFKIVHDGPELLGTVWWTWLSDDQTLTTCPVELADELALPASTRKSIAQDKGLAEIRIAKNAIIEAVGSDAQTPLYRPTGLEGFGKNTPFRAHRSSDQYGMTHPIPPRTRKWPELISQAFRYQSLPEHTEVQVTFRKKQST